MSSVINDKITKTIIETIEFLSESLVDVDNGKEKDDMVKGHSLNLVKLIGNHDVDLADATSAMRCVREHASLLGDDNVSLIRNAISRSSGPTHVRQSKKTEADSL